MAVKKKKSDPFWLIMVVIAIFSFITSYFIFYQLTGKVETKSIKTSKPIVVSASPEDKPIEETIVIGNGQGGSPTPNPESVTITPEPSGGVSAKPVSTPSSIPSVVASIQPSVIATPTLKPTPMSTSTPSPTPVKTVAPLPTKAAVSVPPPPNKTSYFKVRVGSFDSRGDAEKKAKDLESLGYETSVIDEPEGSYVQVGSFRDQEKALSLAEEVSQKGFSVIIRQLEE